VSNGEAEPEETAAPSRWPALLAALLIVAAVAVGALTLFLVFLLRS
jgi:hypothetical protein